MAAAAERAASVATSSGPDDRRLTRISSARDLLERHRDLRRPRRSRGYWMKSSVTSSPTPARRRAAGAYTSIQATRPSADCPRPASTSPSSRHSPGVAMAVKPARDLVRHGPGVAPELRRRAERLRRRVPVLEAARVGEDARRTGSSPRLAEIGQTRRPEQPGRPSRPPRRPRARPSSRRRSGCFPAWWSTLTTASAGGADPAGPPSGRGRWCPGPGNRRSRSRGSLPPHVARRPAGAGGPAERGPR